MGDWKNSQKGFKNKEVGKAMTNKLKNNSRTKNSFRNLSFSIIAYVIQIILGFFTRRYFIYYFGTEYLGLNSLFSNILSILSLAELGFGTAIVFSMYKPMAEEDTEKVSELLNFYKKCYTIIGFIVIALGFCVLPFMSYFKSKAPNVDVDLYLVYIIFLFNTAISYFFAYRRSLLYTSQRNDIESKINMMFNIVSSGLQLIILLFIKNYYLYILVSGIVSLSNNFVVYGITNRLYSEYLKKPTSKIDSGTKKEINKNIKALIFHKIGTAIVYSTDSILIFVLLGSTSLGKYSNYLLITSYVTTFISFFTAAVRGSIGNSIATESVEKNTKLFSKLNFVYMWLVSFCTVCIFVLADPFIDTVFNKGSTELLFDKTIIILICVNFFTTVSRYMCGTFKECAGIFYQDRYKSLIEAIVNLVSSVIFAKFIGLAGIILGTIISNVFVSLWVEPYVLNKYYMKQSTIKYFFKYTIFVVATVVTALITQFVCNKLPTGGVTLLVARFAICAILPNICLFLCLCWMPEFRECLNYFSKLVTKFTSKKKSTIALSSTPAVANSDTTTSVKQPVSSGVMIVDKKSGELINTSNQDE